MDGIESILQAVVVRSAAWAWMSSRYLDLGPHCPGCRGVITGARALAAFHSLGTVYCAGCGKRFVATFGTPIHETSWQPEEYVQCLVLHLAGRQAREIATHLGKSDHSIRDMIERIRLHHAAVPSAAMAPSVRQSLTVQG